MKKILFSCLAPLLVLLLAMPAAALNWDGNHQNALIKGNLRVGTGSTPDITQNGDDVFVEGQLEVDGVPRFDASTMILRGLTYTLPAAHGAGYFYNNGTGTISFAAGTAGTLDDAYNLGASIIVDAGAVTLTNNAANNTGVLALGKTPAGAQSGDILTITGGANGSGDMIQFANTGSGLDLAGSGATWTVTKLGAFTGASANFSGDVAAGSVTVSGAWTIGNGVSTIGVNSSTWDISTAGAVSGVTTLGMSGNLTLSAGSISLANGQALKGSAVSGETVALQVYDNDTGPGYKDAILLTNGNTPAILIGDNNPTVAINSADWDISTTGAMTGIGAITMDGLLTGTAGATVSGAVVNLNADSNFAVNVASGSSTGTVTIGGTANQQIDIGNGAAVKTVALGSSNTTSTTTLLSGSGGVNVNASNNQPTNINTGTSTGTVTIGNTTPAVVNVLGTVSVNANAAALATNIGTGTTTGTVTIGGAGAQSIDIGTGAAAKTVALGSSNTTSTTTILSGSGGVEIQLNNNQPVDIATGTSTGTVTLGGAGAQSIDIGVGAAAKTVRVGSTNTTSATTISAGSGGINLAGLVAATPQSINVTTEANLTITGTLVILNGDNDSDSDTVDLQNGTVTGQLLIIAAGTGVDADDTISINYGDTTATNAAACTFNKTGESCAYFWTGADWVQFAAPNTSL